MPAELLVEFIIAFHTDILAMIEETEKDFTRLRNFLGIQIPTITEAHLIFQDGSRKIKRHLKKESTAVLPFAKRYAKALETGRFNRPGLSSSCGPVQKMYQEHKEETFSFTLILYMLRRSELPTSFQPLANKISVNLLELKSRWEEQIELENDVLFPKIIEMESLLYPI